MLYWWLIVVTVVYGPQVAYTFYRRYINNRTKLTRTSVYHWTAALFPPIYIMYLYPILLVILILLILASLVLIPVFLGIKTLDIQRRIYIIDRKIYNYFNQKVK